MRQGSCLPGAGLPKRRNADARVIGAYNLPLRKHGAQKGQRQQRFKGGYAEFPIQNTRIPHLGIIVYSWGRGYLISRGRGLCGCGFL